MREVISALIVVVIVLYALSIVGELTAKVVVTQVGSACIYTKFGVPSITVVPVYQLNDSCTAVPPTPKDH